MTQVTQQQQRYLAREYADKEPAPSASRTSESGELRQWKDRACELAEQVAKKDRELELLRAEIKATTRAVVSPFPENEIYFIVLGLHSSGIGRNANRVFSSREDAIKRATELATRAHEPLGYVVLESKVLVTKVVPVGA